MRIAYGIHGYGRGHAMRALGVLGQLVERHDVLILAGTDAYDLLAAEFPVVRIPALKFHYDKNGRLSNWTCIRKNLGAVLDVRNGGPSCDMVGEVLAEFKPDVVVTDSDPFTLRAAGMLKIPRITFDHYSFLIHAMLDLNWRDRLVLWGDKLVYGLLLGGPDRVIASCFFDAPVLREGVRTVGAVIRKEVRQMTPTRGDYLLVYLNKGDADYVPSLERALMGLDCPVVVYGAPRQGEQGNLRFKPLANKPFIEDLAGCRAVFATTGNQLCGEVMYFRKPMLGMPMPCLEQRLNAMQLDRLGIGMQVRRGKVTAELLRRFMDREQEFVGNFPVQPRNGAEEALEAIEEYAAELISERKASKGAE